MRRYSLELSLVIAALIFVAFETANAASLGERANADPKIGKFWAAIHTCGLDRDLANHHFTVFAPTDDALAAMPNKAWETLQSADNRALLTQFLKHHIVAGDYPSSRLVKAKIDQYGVRTLDGSEILIDKRKALLAGGVPLYHLDMTADNGTIHVIDKPLAPASTRALWATSDKK